MASCASSTTNSSCQRAPLLQMMSLEFCDALLTDSHGIFCMLHICTPYSVSLASLKTPSLYVDIEIFMSFKTLPHGRNYAHAEMAHLRGRLTTMATGTYCLLFREAITPALEQCLQQEIRLGKLHTVSATHFYPLLVSHLSLICKRELTDLSTETWILVSYIQWSTEHSKAVSWHRSIIQESR